MANGPSMSRAPGHRRALPFRSYATGNVLLREIKYRYIAKQKFSDYCFQILYNLM